MKPRTTLALGFVIGVFCSVGASTSASAWYNDGGFWCSNVYYDQWCWDDGPNGGYDTWDHSSPHGYHNWVRTETVNESSYNPLEVWTGMWPQSCEGSTSCNSWPYNNYGGPGYEPPSYGLTLCQNTALLGYYGENAGYDPWLAEAGQSNHSYATIWGYADNDASRC